ncbi:tetraspanin-9 [Drosophila innubila]|uniref:tetraspanin-9 n=1 Tax=Drosophila innubila TaxID=198719 RepID=UPI00148CA6F5|nr:tetraspanin-9 [Drosophila innubila]
MACSTKLLKVFALIWDLIYVLLGVAVIGIGVYIIIRFEHFNTAAFIIIGFGIIILLASLFGTLGAARESSRMTKSFVAALIVLIVLQVLTVSFFWTFQTSLLINVDKTFDKLWHNQPVPIKPENDSQIASIEKWLDCCGNVSYKDYMLPPKTCYNKETDKLNLEGCRQKFLDYIAERWTAFNIFSLILVGVEIICALLAYVLANSIVNRWRRSKYFSK